MSKWRPSQDLFPRKYDEIVDGENLTQFFHFVYFPHSCSLHIFLIFILFLVAISILIWKFASFYLISIHSSIYWWCLYFLWKENFLFFSCSYCCYSFLYLHIIALFRWVGIKMGIYEWIFLTSDMSDMNCFYNDEVNGLGWMHDWGIKIFND